MMEKRGIPCCCLQGGAGYIGSHACIAFIQSGFEVVVLDNLSNSSEESLKRVRELTGRTIPFFRADILDKEALTRVFSENRIEAVVHFAGLKSATESVADPLRYYRNNVSGTQTLLEAMNASGVHTLLFSSSAAVYGAHNLPPYTEDMPLGRCANPYGQTKAVIEGMLEALAASNPAWSVGILRYFNAVGAHESGRIGEDPTGKPANLCPAIAQVAVGRLPILEINGVDYDTPDGTGVRDYIHVMDLARAHAAAMKKILEKPGVSVYNLGTGKGISVKEMLSAFEAASGRQIPSRVAPRRPGDLATAYADVSKAERELNWRAEYGLESMARDTWRWQSGYPNGYKKL